MLDGIFTECCLSKRYQEIIIKKKGQRINYVLIYNGNTKASRANCQLRWTTYSWKVFIQYRNRNSFSHRIIGITLKVSKRKFRLISVCFRLQKTLGRNRYILS